MKTPKYYFFSLSWFSNSYPEPILICDFTLTLSCCQYFICMLLDLHLKFWLSDAFLPIFYAFQHIFNCNKLYVPHMLTTYFNIVFLSSFSINFDFDFISGCAYARTYVLTHVTIQKNKLGLSWAKLRCQLGIGCNLIKICCIISIIETCNYTD